MKNRIKIDATTIVIFKNGKVFEMWNNYTDTDVYQIKERTPNEQGEYVFAGYGARRWTTEELDILREEMEDI